MHYLRLALLGLLVIPASLSAGELAAKAMKVSGVVIEDQMDDMARVGMKLENTGKATHTLVAAYAPIAVQTQLHVCDQVDGKSVMRQISGVTVPAEGETVLRSAGLHVMLMGLKAPLKPGEEVPLRLIFGDGSSVEVLAKAADK
ncbi:MAG: copper chaperone PCu(A)C [Verrucomicrobiota bacterium]